MSDLIGRINWVDIFAITLLIRITYIAVKTGFWTEVSKLLGTACAIYLACHHYTRVSIFFSSRLHLESQTLINLLDFSLFFILAVLGYFLFAVIRRMVSVLVKVETVSLLNRWGALVLSFLRWSLFASLVIFTSSVLNNAYLNNSILNSLSGSKIFRLTPKVYYFLWDKLMCHLEDERAINKAVFQVGRIEPEPAS